MSQKRKHVTLTLDKKYEILKRLEQGDKMAHLCEEYDIGRATIYGIKNKKNRIETFFENNESTIIVRKTLKPGDFPQVEDALYAWFIEERNRHTHISGEILMNRAKMFYKKIMKKDDFHPSVGWLDRFKRRYGIRLLSLNGEGRCGITPVKPQRTGSMRDANSTTKDSITKESSKQCTIQNDSDNVYECVGVSSAPECDMSLPTYYGSETESDIYYPYITFQNGECKTKIKRKERGIVHSTLEENYGAVIIANHDALTNLFHQMMSKKPDLPKEMQGIEWKWNCFDVVEEEVQKLGNLTFINAKIKEIPITLSITSIESSIPDIMEPLTQFKCPVPIQFLQNGNNAFITVMRRKKIERLSSFAKKLEKSAESVREGVYILLQVVKYLSVSKGKVNTENFVVFTSENSSSAAYLPAEDSETICVEDCLREMCKQLLGPLPLGRVVEKCNIAEAEGVLEVWLWGPASPLALPSLARWLDLERANFLNALVSNRNNAVVDKEQLAFLVRATPKSIAHSSQIIEHNAA